MQSVKADELPQNPRERVNKLSVFMFCFTLPTFVKGFKKTLDQSDLFSALKSHRSELLGTRLAKYWSEELSTEPRKQKKEPSLLRATFKAFGLNFILLGIILLILELGLKVAQPIFLGYLVSYYGKGNRVTESESAQYWYAAGVIACSALVVSVYHPYMFAMMHLGMKIRVAMCSLIYRKALRLSPTALGETTSGQVVNLISNDVGRLDTAIMHVHFLWLGPLQCALVSYLMYREVGAAAFFGVGVLLLFLPLQMYMGKLVSVLRLRTALRTDSRVRMMNEIISGIQVIKMYAWEKPFAVMVEYARRKEMQNIRSVNFLRGTMQSFMIFMSRVCVFSSLVGYVLLGHFLTAEKAFVLTAYFNILRMTMTMSLPIAITQYAELMVSLGRIQSYLKYDETQVTDKSEALEEYKNHMNHSAIISENGKSITEAKSMKIAKDVGITINNLTAQWDRNNTKKTLKNITLNIKPRKLVAIVGPVGSGKSSLIYSILGELPKESGSIDVKGTLSYACQEPWLFTGTVRSNILFGLPMDKFRYRAVVKKCALERDFELLPQGDKTIVGERGASLSGGQKARISLARAVYRDADIYLLDDPLSAVDTHVGRHLFEQCMRGYLREKIVVLVTHQLQYLEKADLIVTMDKGNVIGVGTYDAMLSSGLDFAKLLTGPEKKPENNGSADGNEKQNLSRQNSRQRSRQNSISSMSSIADSLIEESPMTVQESRSVGDVGFEIYKKYFTSGGGYFFSFITLVTFLCVQLVASMSDYFLSYWTAKSERVESTTDLLDIYIFAGLVVAIIIFTFGRCYLTFELATRSSNKLHNTMYNGVTHAAMYFFNTNPSGRILNRFSKDMGQVDEILPSVIMDVIQICLSLIGTIVLISIVNPWNLLVTAVLCTIFYFLRVFYLRTSIDVKRLEAITRSPIYSHLGASLNGLTTIRVFGAQKVLIEELDNYQNLHSSTYYMFLSTSRAFAYWLDWVCVIYIAIITLSFFISPSSGSNVGLAITQALGLTGMVQWGMRQSAELENNMTAVERLVEYETIEPEGEFDSKLDKKPPATWPENGRISFKDLSLRYFPDPKAEYVLRALKFEILPTEKVGVVGRTGAGKSSLINALFRLSYNEGSIIIDNRDTKEMGLTDLRSKISIIPQEPVLFSGTMRYNLDPNENYSDAQLWQALEEVKLKSAVSELPNGLQSKISEGGSNFSVGQRQLVCLARAILRENKILVMDEATANVDPQTDALIQTTIRKKFEYCTVLTIAHRLHTVMDSDKVLVMDAGRAVEFGSPYELLTQSKTKVFYGMLQQTGSSTFETLFNVAQKAHEEQLQAKKGS